MHSEMFFQAETGTHSPFKGESFYGCTSCLFSISLNSECRQKNVTNSQQRKSYMKKSKMLKRQWEKLRSSRLPSTQGTLRAHPHPKMQLQLLPVLFEQITCNTILPLHGRASLSYREHFPGLTLLCSSIGFNGFSKPFFSQRGEANALTSQAF